MLDSNKVYVLKANSTIMRFVQEVANCAFALCEVMVDFLATKGIDISVENNLTTEEEIKLVDEIAENVTKDTDLERQIISLSNDLMLRTEHDQRVVFIKHLENDVTSSIILLDGALHLCQTRSLVEDTLGDETNADS